MNREEARNEIKGRLTEYVERVTKKSQGKNMYICPICGSGEGKHKTGAFSIKDGNSWKCFSCNNGGDIFDLICKLENITDYNAQLKRAADILGINITESAPPKANQNNTKSERHGGEKMKEKEDYTAFFLQAHKNIDKTDYWKKRGISRELVDRFNIGYVENWKTPTNPNAPTSPRLIIPTSDYSYLARDTRENLTNAQMGYSKMKVGGASLFNKNVIKTAKKPIFVVEGEIDALSIMEAGGESLALGSTTNVKAFIELVKLQPPESALLLALDNDAAGNHATKELIEALESLKIKHYRVDIIDIYKDPNEALQQNREAFINAVKAAEKIEFAEERLAKENYLKNSTENYLQSFLDGIADSVNTPFISTGFSKLDSVLDGGLYEGLYIVGAISSLGKTTLITQIADQIAQGGKDVLIFSLEMARTEIMAKSISRHTIERAIEDGIDPRNAKTARGITTGARYPQYNQTEIALINDAVKSYGEYAKHIFISEGIGDIGAEQIRKTVKQHIRFTGNVPVVVIDYIQILAPYNDRATDKQNTDKAVMELKRISRDYKTPVIGISSFNRANYSVPVTMEAFKESGAIEYSSDVLIGLQLKGAGQKDFDANQAKRKVPREVELVILKNRNGRTGDIIDYNYYPLFNYFTES